MSQRKISMEGEEPDSRKNFLESLPAEVLTDIVETVNGMSESPADRFRQLATLGLVSRYFRNVTQPLLFDSVEICDSERRYTPAASWAAQLTSMAQLIVCNPDLARSIKNLRIESKGEPADYFWPLLGNIDDEPLVPLLLQLQSVAEETNGTKFRAIAPGDNIVDAFMEAIFSLCTNAYIEANLKAIGVDDFPRVSQFQRDSDSRMMVTYSVPCLNDPSALMLDNVPGFKVHCHPGWGYQSGRYKGYKVAGFYFYAETTFFGTFRHFIQNAADRRLTSLSLTAWKQTEPLDFGDVISASEASHKTIMELELRWDPLDSDNPPTMNMSNFSLEAFQDLRHLYLGSWIFKAATTEDCSACMLPKSLESLQLGGYCNNDGLDKLEKLLEEKHLPNFKVVYMDAFNGTPEKLAHFRLQMARAGIEVKIFSLSYPNPTTVALWGKLVSYW